MKFFAAAIALAVAAVANAGSYVSFTDCASGSDLTLNTLYLDPYPICVGQDVCATITGTLSADVTAPSTMSIIGTYFGSTVYTQSLDVCTLVSCPVPQSTTSMTFCFPVLSSAPAGIPVVLTITATNGNGNTLFCGSFTTTGSNC
ncbi:hypothetical protein BGZ80_008620 [Entomortierella chlamydospora]|uniref:Phosphatidylglycerol/phosphatidylinositol transfer protein n=1 Tax=Entomortierella chlamydospora TaxID=101097 RepID=A0A9P6MCR4_9FUNG|nr:hypothetical protein BGZ79_005135 [Entomortierella chlamydospora]KAF9992305.1 hypothetical protein BGZ80_008620 [Entomortierella chlamydospora]